LIPRNFDRALRRRMPASERTANEFRFAKASGTDSNRPGEKVNEHGSDEWQ
jgi:hypothetical protein